MNPNDPLPRAPTFSLWAWAAAAAALGLVLWGDVSRFRDPVGEKIDFFMAPGSADFALPFLASYAMLNGEDPYLSRDERFLDPWRREYELPDGRRSAQVYLPTHFLAYAPLVILTGGDYRAAGRIWFGVNVLLLLALAGITWRLTMLATGLDRLPREWTIAFALFPLIVLGLGLPAMFLLERGQSDALAAVLLWGAVLLALRDRVALSLFLAVAGTLFKGYGAVLTLGLALLFGRARWRAVASGTSAALVLLLLPVVNHLPTALSLIRARTDLFFDAWANHSFKNLVYLVSPEWSDAGARVLTVGALGAALLCWIEARRSLVREAPVAERALWLSLFGVCSLGAVVGYLASSFTYNLLLVLPGVLVLVLGQASLARTLDLRAAGARILGAAVLASVVCLHLYKVGPNPLRKRFSPAGVGLVSVIAVAGAAASVALGRARRDRAAPADRVG